MEGKRASSEPPDNDAETKRAKTGFPLEIALDDGIEYINLSCLLKTAPFAAYFAKHYKKSEKRFIEEEQLEIFNVSKQSVASGLFKNKTAYSPANDLRLVKKDGKINDFISRVQRDSHPTAPPILLDDLAFTDAIGDSHSVEMRGERTEEGIFFKAKDIGSVFKSSNIADNIQHNHTQLEEGEDFVWFTIPEGERKKHGPSRELFFTYSGMLAAVFISKSPAAKQFRKWVSKTVFVHHLGTQKQKRALAKSLLNKKAIDDLTKRCVNKIACIYLLETGKLPIEVDGVAKRVYKFGFSKNVKDRMDKHITRYGRDSVIDTLVLLPLEHVSTAELKLKHSLGDRYKYNDDHDPSTELLLLSQADHTTVRDVMRVVGETFFGETVVHMHSLAMLQQSHDHAIEMLKVTHALEVSKKDQELIGAKKDLELAKKDNEILEMKNEAQARRIQELEDKHRRYTKNNASIP